MRLNVILYADDILLMCDNYASLQKILNITEEFGKKWELKFNPTKTVYMEFGKCKTTEMEQG